MQESPTLFDRGVSELHVQILMHLGCLYRGLASRDWDTREDWDRQRELQRQVEGLKGEVLDAPWRDLPTEWNIFTVVGGMEGELERGYWVLASTLEGEMESESESESGDEVVWEWETGV